MAQVDRHVVSARSLCLAVLILITTSIYVASNDRQDKKTLHKAGQLLAYWILCNELQEDYKDFRAFNETGNYTTETDRLVRIGYYSGLGQTHLYRLADSYEIKLVQPRAGGAMQQIPDLRPWKKTVGSDLTLRIIFEPASELQKSLAEFGKAAQDEFKNQATEEELNNANSSLLDSRQFDHVWSSLDYDKYKTRLQLDEYMRAHDLTPIDEEIPTTNYKKLERHLYASTIRVPVINLDLSSGVALWALSGVAFVLLVVIRSRVQIIADSRVSSFSEPWILLDANSWMARTTAALWMGSIALAPAIIFSCQASVFHGRYIGGETLEPLFIAEIVGSFSLFALSSINATLSTKALVSMARSWRLQNHHIESPV